jgi:Tol biopolymer transport system component
VGGCARLFGLSLAAFILGVGNTFGGSPNRKLAVEATRTHWADGSDVESGGLNYPTDIYVVDVASGRVRNVTHDERTEYSWSWLPDGRRILFASVPNDRMKRGRSHVFVVDADGRNRRQLTSGTGEVSPELAPGGHHFLFVVEGGRQRGLYVMRVDGTQPKRLTHGHEASYEASWSPDGARIVFVRDFPPVPYKYARSDIFTIRADGTGLDRLTTTKREESAPTWSPNGQKIAFIRESGYWDLVYVMRSDGTRVKKLTRTGHNGAVSWLSNDRVIYYNADEDKWWSIDAGGTEQRQPLFRRSRTRIGNHLWDRRGRDLGALSPDGKWIAFATPGYGVAAKIWIARADGTHRRLVTRKICCIYVTIDWAPK